MFVGTPMSTTESHLKNGIRRIPAELVNFSEDEIWVIARPEMQVVDDENTPGTGAMLARLRQISDEASRIADICTYFLDQPTDAGTGGCCGPAVARPAFVELTGLLGSR